MRSFPLPIRVAAGLAATVVEQTRRLPTYVIGLPVTLASQALQVSMRIQQQVTELAIKGEEALSGFQTPEEQPVWATFDEDVPGSPAQLEPRPGAPARAPSAFDRVATKEPTESGNGAEGSGVATSGERVDDQPSALPELDELTMGQLRGRLRKFSEADLAELLDYERAHQQRPEFLQMLSNRLERVRSLD